MPATRCDGRGVGTLLRAVDAVLGLPEYGAGGAAGGAVGGAAEDAAAAQRAPGGGAPISVAELKMGHELHRFWVSALAVVAFALWVHFSTLDIVSQAAGEVIPSSQVKTVQHLEGGIVREIKVVEGQKVSAGQTLVVLEPTVSGAEVAELRVRLTSLETDIAQLDALARGAETPSFTESLLADHPELAQQARARFDTRLRKHMNDLARQEQTIEQRRQQIRRR